MSTSVDQNTCQCTRLYALMGGAEIVSHLQPYWQHPAQVSSWDPWQTLQSRQQPTMRCTGQGSQGSPPNPAFRPRDSEACCGMQPGVSRGCSVNQKVIRVHTGGSSPGDWLQVMKPFLRSRFDVSLLGTTAYTYVKGCKVQMSDTRWALCLKKQRFLAGRPAPEPLTHFPSKGRCR